MDVQTATIVITGISIVIGVILSLNSRKQELETRQAQLFMEVYNRWSSPEFTQAYRIARYQYTYTGGEDYLRDVSDSALGKIDPNLYISIQTLATYFEGIGVLVKRNLIDIELVEDLFAGRFIWIWEHFGIPSASIVREQQNDPLLYDGMEYLYREMKRRQQLPATP